MVKDKSGEGGQTAVGLDPIKNGVQSDVLQRGRAVMSCRRTKSQEVRAVTWNVSSMVCRSGKVVDDLHRRMNDLCCAQETRWKFEDALCYWVKIQVPLAGLCEYCPRCLCPTSGFEC